MRNKIYSDREYMRHLQDEWGVDLIGRRGTSKAVSQALDPDYFFHEDDAKKDEFFYVPEEHYENGVRPLKIVEE